MSLVGVSRRAESNVYQVLRPKSVRRRLRGIVAYFPASVLGVARVSQRMGGTGRLQQFASPAIDDDLRRLFATGWPA